MHPNNNFIMTDKLIRLHLFIGELEITTQVNRITNLMKKYTIAYNTP